MLFAALVLSAGSIALNPAQEQLVTVSGAVPPLTATLQSGIVTAVANAAGTQVTVTATQQTGSDLLTLTDAAGDTASLPVRVAFNAGTIPAQVSLTITGDPVDPAWLAAQITSAVTNATTILPGARVTVAPPSPPPISPGVAANVPVPVQIAGNGTYFDQIGAANVSVTDLPLTYAPAQLLFYDDDPENVAAAGVLYRGTVTQSGPARLYTYHEDTDDALGVAVVLQAPVATRVQAIDALAGPNIDVMSVGHAVGVEYLAQAPADEGVVIPLTARTPYVLHDTATTHGQLVAEALYLRVLSGGPVTVTVLSVDAGTPVVSALTEPEALGDGHHRTGIFDIGDYASAAATYTAGGPDATVTYGGRVPTPPNVLAGSPGRDFGGYGVVHRIVFTLVNPTGAEANAYLYEEPSGGPVRSSFLVDGSLVQVGCAREPVPYQVQAYGLAPHQTYAVRIETMTDGGSSYPLTLGVTGTPPQPQTPPIRSQNGCFPAP